MTPERRQQIEELYRAASHQPIAERAMFLTSLRWRPGSAHRGRQATHTSTGMPRAMASL